MRSTEEGELSLLAAAPPASQPSSLQTAHLPQRSWLDGVNGPSGTRDGAGDGVSGGGGSGGSLQSTERRPTSMIPPQLRMLALG
jgi:hypothetical protein